jgi:hypothetical protein
MKTLNTLLRGTLVLFLLTVYSGFAQDNAAEEFEPVYITMTTSHWNPDPDVNFDDWKATEKEYFDKVTMKNDLILSSGYYTHYFTPDNSEIVMVSVYKNWEDIEKAAEKSNELAMAAWPDEAARKAFFDKQGKYYSPQHSDEIYVSLPFTFDAESEPDEPRVVYLRYSQMALTGEGKPGLMKEYFEKVTNKLSLLKAYYTHRHLWGSDSRQFAEAYFYDNFADIEKTFDEIVKLENEAWPDEAEREEFLKNRNKMFTGKHSDYIYRTVPGLMK